MRAVREARPGWLLELASADEGEFTAGARELGVNVRILPFPPAFAQLGDASAGGPAGNQTSPLSTAAKTLLVAPPLCAYLRKLSLLIGEHNPDVIHSNGLKTHI